MKPGYYIDHMGDLAIVYPDGESETLWSSGSWYRNKAGYFYQEEEWEFICPLENINAKPGYYLEECGDFWVVLPGSAEYYSSETEVWFSWVLGADSMRMILSTASYLGPL